MAKVYFPGFYQSEMLMEPQTNLPDVSDDVSQTIARLMGFDRSNLQFRFINVDNLGNLFGSIGPTKGANFNTSQATVTSTSVTILAANTSRKSFILANLGTYPVFLGNAQAVSTTTGFPLFPGGIYSDDVYTGIVWGVAALGSNIVAAAELS